MTDDQWPELDLADPGSGFKGGFGTPKMLKLSIMNLNKQSKLFSQGMVPIVMRVPNPSANSGGLSRATLKQQAIISCFHYPDIFRWYFCILRG